MAILTDVLRDKKTVAIIGHVNPDGDCIGSCLAMYNYLRESFPGLSVSVFLESAGVKFSYLKGYEEIRHTFDEGACFDLCITLDASDVPRLGMFAPYLETARDSLCIDHHITNQGMGRVNVIESGASSTCEVLYGLLDREKLSLDTAKCLYTGIVHDTGVFKYSNTSRKTMEIAGTLMELGVDFSQIIDGSFYLKTYGQIKLQGQALLKSRLFCENRVIGTVVELEDMIAFGCTSKDTDGIIDQMRVTEGVECAVLLYATGRPSEYKVSLRSNSGIDASRVAMAFGGGGHVKASGCTRTGEPDAILAELCGQIALQWDESAGEQAG